MEEALSNVKNKEVKFTLGEEENEESKSVQSTPLISIKHALKKEFRKTRGKSRRFQTFAPKKPFWMDSSLFQVMQPFTGDEIDETKSVSSLFTILSIWNTMVGSTSLSIPNAVYHAGLIPTIGKKH